MYMLIFAIEILNIMVLQGHLPDEPMSSITCHCSEKKAGPEGAAEIKTRRGTCLQII